MLLVLQVPRLRRALLGHLTSQLSLQTPRPLTHVARCLMYVMLLRLLSLLLLQVRPLVLVVSSTVRLPRLLLLVLLLPRLRSAAH